jgi:GNAT superfamily N-acetyltransferase
MGGSIDIDRLVVDPEWMRCGIASALVGSLDSRAAITVSTGTGNEPAHRLYVGVGVVAVGETTPVPGLSVTHFVRVPSE